MTTTPGRSAAQEDTLFVEGRWSVRQSYAEDPMLHLFFEELRKNRRLVGGVVPCHEHVIFPPQRYCERTYEEVKDVVAVGPGGVIRAVTEVMMNLPGAPTPPYLVAFIQLDGTSNASPGYLRGEAANAMEPIKLVGARCHAVFKPECAGDWEDFWFELDQ
jgi:uncharacterized OB-fold protein